MELRPNQISPVEKGVKYFKEKKPKPSIIVAPTAFGKSIVIAKIAKQIGEKVLVIQPSKELLEQNYGKFIRLGGEASIYSASMGEKEIGHVTYATIGSIVNVAPKFKELGISKVIIDECDRYPREPSGMLRRFLKGAGITHTLGLTATPLKLQTNMGRDGMPYSKLTMLTSRSKKGNFFKKIIHVAQIQDMVENEYWSPLKYLSFDFNSDSLEYNSTGADFTADSMLKAYKEEDINKKIKIAIEKLVDRKGILIAVPSIEEAKKLADELPNAAAVYSEMPRDERRRIIDEFTSGKIRIVVQVSILSVGFDYPELDCIIIARPTASISWYYQFIGRVTRIAPTKQDAIVVDFVGAVQRFGKVENFYFEKEKRTWILYGEEDKRLSGIPIKEIGLHIKGEPSPHEEAGKGKTVTMPFGKYEGKPVQFIPKYYRDWMMENFNWHAGNIQIKEEIERLAKIGV